MIEKIEEYVFTEKKSYLIIFDVNSWFEINAPGINFPYTADTYYFQCSYNLGWVKYDF